MTSRARASLASLALVVALSAWPARAGAEPSATFAVLTVPATPGLTFAFGAERFTTTKNGRALVTVSGRRMITILRNPYALGRNIDLVPTTRRDGSRFRVQRWYSKNVHGVRTLVAALEGFVPTTFRFANLTGHPFATRNVGTMTVKRIDGQVTTLTGEALTRPVLLQATRVVPLAHGLVSKHLLYRVQAVTINGSNLVNRAQQAFTPAEQRNVTLKLLFYSARFVARDRLFHFPIGSGIRLEYPNHVARFYKFDDDGALTLPALPRGSYRVTVKAPAISVTSPVAMTRNQIVTIKVISYLDVAVILLLFAAIVTVLLLARRPLLRTRLRRLVTAPIERARQRRRPSLGADP